MRSASRAIFLFFFLGLSGSLISSAYADQVGDASSASTTDTADAGTDAEQSGDLIQKTLILDIKTASFLNLAAWCKSLGLSDSGTKDALMKRLMSYYGVSDEKPQKNAEGNDTAAKNAGAKGVAAAESRTITIETAQGVEYFTLQTSNEEYARLRGGVVVSFVDGDVSHRLQADEVLYNRTTETITARGGVIYTKESGGSTEVFTGQSLSVNAKDWTGVFIDGTSDLSKKTADQAYSFTASIISRSDEDVTILDDAVVSTAGNDEPYWSMAASKIWILPGGEWAIVNAVFKVGEVPLMYIPFFYLPGDDAIFHPVLGYRSREGSFLQTTTYLFGRPAVSTSTSSSITSILDSSKDQETRREGLFLRQTGKKLSKTAVPSLSVLFDAYSNLGAYLGAEYSSPAVKPWSATSISAGIGFTRDIYYSSSTGYSIFDSSGETTWNDADLFGLSTPFRYRLLATTGYSSTLGSFSLSLPLYSDSFVNRDFLNRSEDMDWLGSLTSDSDSTTTIAAITSFDWKVSGAFTPKLKSLSPGIQKASISSAYSSLAFSSKQLATYTDTDYSPSDRFFYPSKLTILSLSGTLSGTPLGATTSSSSTTQKEVDPAAAFKDSLRSPWAEDAGGVPSAVAGAKNDGGGAFQAPTLSQSFSSSTSSYGKGPSLGISYTFTPSFVAEAPFLTSSWSTRDDVDWSSFSSLALSAASTGSLTTTLSSTEGALSAQFVFSENTKWAAYPYLNEEDSAYDTQTERDAKAEAAYEATYFKTTGSATLTAKPFTSAMWSASNFTYKTTALLAKSAFTGSADDPSWDVEWGDWTSSDSITANSLAANLQAVVRDKTQTLTLTAQLPPLDTTAQASTSLSIGPTTTSLSIKAVDLDADPSFDPISATETVKFGTSSSLKTQAIYDPEEDEFTSFSTSLTANALTASFIAKDTSSYSLVENEGWVVDDDSEDFRAQSFSLSFKAQANPGRFWKRRVSFSGSATSSLSIDFIKFTESAFSFTTSATLKVSDFLDLSFSSTSQNTSVYKYLLLLHMDAFTLPDWASDIESENPFVDLFKSFNFWNESDRRASNFKLKALKVSAIHYLGDWTATFSYSVAPELDETAKKYVFNNEVSFLVKWTPIEEFKTGFIYDEDGFDLDS